MRNEDIRDLFEKWGYRCNEHGTKLNDIDKKLDEALRLIHKNKEDITVIKTERRVLVWVAGIIGATLSFMADYFIRKN